MPCLIHEGISIQNLQDRNLEVEHPWGCASTGCYWVLFKAANLAHKMRKLQEKPAWTNRPEKDILDQLKMEKKI